MGTGMAVTEEPFAKGSDKSWLGTRMGLQDMRSITLDISSFPAECETLGYIPSGTPLGKITASGLYGPYQPEREEVQSVIDVGGSAGTFKLTLGGQQTGAIQYNASAGDVQTALEALSNVAPAGADLVCTGGPLPTAPVVVTFTNGGAFDATNVAEMIVEDSVTDGNAVVTTGLQGQAAASDGRETFAGLLFEEVGIGHLRWPLTLASMANVGAALFWNGVVIQSKLPVFGLVAGPIDAAAKTAVKTIEWR